MPAARRPDRPAPADPAAPSAPVPLINPEDHLKWARAIARGVRADYRFQSGSQEELELEATAHLVLCEYAPRFDPVLSFKTGAALVMSRAALAQKRGADPPPGPSVLARPVAVCGTDVTAWVRHVATRVSRRRTTGRGACFEAAARAGAAVARAFDPVGAFRGWCAVEIRSRCRREAARLRNGGTYHTKRGGPVIVVSLPRARGANPAGAPGEPRTWSDAAPKWEPAGELDTGAARVRLEQLGAPPASAPPDRRPRLDGEDPDEPWTVFDTTPEGGARAGEHLETDGRRPGAAEPLDALIDSGGDDPPDNWRAIYDTSPEQ